MEIYLDLLVILNFLVDFLLLLGTNRLAGFPPSWQRLLPAAALGGLYSGLCLIPRLFFLGSPLWRLISLGLISLIAFGLQQNALRRAAVFILLSLALGGLALAMQQARFGILLLEAGILWLLTRTAFGDDSIGREYIPLQITFREKTVSLIALRDTGNHLKDPVTGEPVIVISPEKAQLLTGLTRQQLEKPLETMLSAPLPGLHLIPYSSVGAGYGMLLGMRFSQVRMGNRQQTALIGFAPEHLGTGSTYQALTGGGL